MYRVIVVDYLKLFFSSEFKGSELYGSPKLVALQTSNPNLQSLLGQRGRQFYKTALFCVRGARQNQGEAYIMYPILIYAQSGETQSHLRVQHSLSRLSHGQWAKMFERGFKLVLVEIVITVLFLLQSIQRKKAKIRCHFLATSTHLPGKNKDFNHAHCVFHFHDTGHRNLTCFITLSSLFLPRNPWGKDPFNKLAIHNTKYEDSEEAKAPLEQVEFLVPSLATSNGT